RHNFRKNKRVFGTSVEKRPESFASREICGHWEIDTVIGHKNKHESVVLTLVEKMTDYYLAIKIPSKTSEAVIAALEVLKEEYGEEYFNEVFKSITADNGSEFEGLSTLEEYGVKVYFAHPYSSWERPQNERHNRIFRRYIPKGVSIEKYTAEQILCFADDMNALPRRILGYATPEELFDAFLDQVYSLLKVQGNLLTTSVQFEIAI
ncbi:MAG: IS30 family transposase, partial [Lachnospiraceae bacterium]|nr:IS30 family transposase [Lachnospiraceae bacterium]